MTLLSPVGSFWPFGGCKVARALLPKSPLLRSECAHANKPSRG